MRNISYDEMMSNTVLTQYMHDDGFVQVVRDDDDLGGHDSLEQYYDDSLDDD